MTLVDMRAAQILESLMQLIDLHSVFAAALLEKFIPVLPSYVLFPAIGMGANSLYDLACRCLIATAGSVGGAAGWYAIGSLIGPWRVRRLSRRYGRWIFLSPHLYETLADSYQRWPLTITLVGQLIPTVRIYQALPAGVLRLPVLPFLLATGVGASCWIVPLASAGHILRRYGWTASEIGLGMLVATVTVEGLALIAAFRRGRLPRDGTGP